MVFRNTLLNGSLFFLMDRTQCMINSNEAGVKIMINRSIIQGSGRGSCMFLAMIADYVTNLL
jgi:hypothetical protein